MIWPEITPYGGPLPGLQSKAEIVYNCAVIWEDCRLARAGRLSKGLVRASAEASQSGN